MQRKVSCAQKKTTCWVSSASIYPFHLCPEGYGHGHPSHSDFYVLEPVAGQPYSFSSSTSPPLPLWGWAPDKGIWVQVAFLRSTATTNACQRQGHCLRWSSPNIYLRWKLQSPIRNPSCLQGQKVRGPKRVHAQWAFSLVGLELSGHCEWEFTEEEKLEVAEHGVWRYRGVANTNPGEPDFQIHLLSRIMIQDAKILCSMEILSSSIL